MKKPTKKIVIFFLVLLSVSLTAISQNHYFGIVGGYTSSIPSKPNGINPERLGAVNGFQVGVFSHFDIGWDFIHVDFSPQYSQYGFNDNALIKYNYLDFDIGLSNFSANEKKWLIAGFGISPSLLLSSNYIEEINSFDLKVYLSIGFRIFENYLIYGQARYGLIEVIPESKVTNLQLSINLHIPIFKI